MINEFIAQVRERGLARTNRYEVMIPFPSDVPGEVGRMINLFAESVSIPGMNISSQPHRTFGEAREMPYERTFEPIQMTFYVDAGMQVKTAFDKWLARIINPQTRTIGYYRDYIADKITLRILNVDDTNPLTINIYEAYPKTIGAIQMGHDSKDIMKLQVTWQYKYWLSFNHNNVGRQSPRPTLGGGTQTYDESSQGVLADDPPVSEEEIIDVEDRETFASPPVDPDDNDPRNAPGGPIPLIT